MKIKYQQNLLAIALVGALAFASTLTRAADLSGSVQGAGKPIAGSTVTIYAAGTGSWRKAGRTTTAPWSSSAWPSRSAPR